MVLCMLGSEDYPMRHQVVKPIAWVDALEVSTVVGLV